MKNLQLAFFKAGVRNQDIPQDHAFFTHLYETATRYGIKTFLSGSNLATESILPVSWGHDALDSTHIKDIFRKQIGQNIDRSKFRLLSFYERYVYYPRIIKLCVDKPLNCVDYNREDAIEMLEEIGWKNYGDKHHESLFTRYFQSYYLYEKFGIDKRRAHLSSMIVSKQISRVDALTQLSELPYDPRQIIFQEKYIAKKLDLSLTQYERHFRGKGSEHYEYNTSTATRIGKKVKKIVNAFI